MNFRGLQKLSDNRLKHSSNKIVELPTNLEQRLRSAMDDVTEGNHSSAFKKFIALIDDGCPAAYDFVGGYYELGAPGLGIEKDYEKARFYYERAVALCGSRESYLALARMYYFGRGVDPDYSKAFEYYDLVAKETEHNGVAYLMLGQMYQQGQGVDKDIQKAKECYEKAWQKGYLLGLTYLGKLEQEMGHPVKGWLHRLKAGFAGFKIARKNPHDSRFRSC